MQHDFYNLKLYPLQDKALQILKEKTAFYLTGGTAISRFHYGHRYSDDLDFFMNRSENFVSEADKVVELLKDGFAKVELPIYEESFVRALVSDEETVLKVELINDVLYHSGDIVAHQLYDKVDNSWNILSNKLSALSRKAGKDQSDIIEICLHLDFQWVDAFEEAQKKDAWVNELGAVKLIGEADMDELMNKVLWVNEPDESLLKHRLETIARDILRGEENSLFVKT